MSVCPGSGGPGTLEFRDGWEEWWVHCPVCGVKWMGGNGEVLSEHRDRRPVQQREAADAETRNSAARALEAKRLAEGRASAQYIGSDFADYLVMFGIIDELSDFDRAVVVDTDAGSVTLDAASVDELNQVLADILPDCWTSRVKYGSAQPEHCEYPEKRLCSTCASAGKRAPKYRPERP